MNKEMSEEISWFEETVFEKEKSFIFSHLQYGEDEEDGNSEDGDRSGSPKPFEK